MPEVKSKIINRNDIKNQTGSKLNFFSLLNQFGSEKKNGNVFIVIVKIAMNLSQTNNERRKKASRWIISHFVVIRNLIRKHHFCVDFYWVKEFFKKARIFREPSVGWDTCWLWFMTSKSEIFFFLLVTDSTCLHIKPAGNRSRRRSKWRVDTN